MWPGREGAALALSAMLRQPLATVALSFIPASSCYHAAFVGEWAWTGPWPPGRCLLPHARRSYCPIPWAPRTLPHALHTLPCDARSAVRHLESVLLIFTENAEEQVGRCAYPPQHRVSSCTRLWSVGALLAHHYLCSALVVLPSSTLPPLAEHFCP